MNVSIHKPTSRVSGNIQLPGSKSISNRILMIKALSGLEFEIENLSDSDDTRYLQDALDFVQTHRSGTIDIGHAGTDMRFLTTFLASQNGSYELTGSERMQQRPIKELVDVLNGLGAGIVYKKEPGYPPLLINGKKVEGGEATISGYISSQFISSLLLAAPYFTMGLQLSITGKMVSRPYIEMTVELMRTFGADITWSGNTITVKPVSYTYRETKFTVESDWSAASFYYSMVALSETGTSLMLSKLFENSLQADIACDQVYNKLGVQTLYSGNEVTITKTQTPYTSCFEYNFINCPDITQTLVCTCVGLNLPFRFTGLQTLKLKETDRIIALKNECAKFGCEICVTEDTIEYDGTIKRSSEPVEIATYNDHRMAMSFAPLCLLSGELIIKHAEVVSKSYPKFWAGLKAIGFTINEH